MFITPVMNMIWQVKFEQLRVSTEFVELVTWHLQWNTLPLNYKPSSVALKLVYSFKQLFLLSSSPTPSHCRHLSCWHCAPYKCFCLSLYYTWMWWTNGETDGQSSKTESGCAYITSCARGDTTCLRPLQVDNIFAFIRQVAPVPTCWLFKTSARTWVGHHIQPWKWCPSHVWRGLPLPILVFLGLFLE